MTKHQPAPQSLAQSSAQQANRVSTPLERIWIKLSPLQSDGTISSTWLLGLVLSIIWLGTLNVRHLLPSDEGRYAEIAREMLVSGNWLVPKYNDYLYFEKPPFHLWMTAIAFKLFGLGEWQARLWSGLSSLLGIFFFSYTAATIWGRRVGQITALILASSPLWILAGHFNALDMGMAFWMGSALCCLLLTWQANPTSNAARNWMLLCWVCMALAVLSKGLIGIVLPGLVLVVYSLTSGDWRSWLQMQWLKGLLIFFLITSPWFILISIEHPSFLHFFFIREHFERFTTNEHARVAPWHYFITLLMVGLLPWLAQLVRALYRTLHFRFHLPLQSPSFKAMWLCCVWFMSILVFFSLSQSKLPGYILPVIPALAILIAISLDHSLTLKMPAKFLRPSPWIMQVGVFLVIFLVGLTQLSLIEKTGEVYEVISYAVYAKWVAFALTIGIIGFLCTLFFYKRQLLSLTIFASTFLLLTLTAGLAHETVGRLLSGVDLAKQVKPLMQPHSKLYAIEFLDHTLPFYLERTSIMVNFKDELAFGIEQEPDKWISDTSEWMQHWRNTLHEDAFAMMTQAKYQSLKEQGFPMEFVASDHLRTIVRQPSLQK